MTKAECVIEDFGFTRAPDRDFQERKHDGGFFTVRVWSALINGHFWTIHCDNYYGRSIVYGDEIRYGDYEYRYEHIGNLVRAQSA